MYCKLQGTLYLSRKKIELSEQMHPHINHGTVPFPNVKVNHWQLCNLHSIQ